MLDAFDFDKQYKYHKEPAHVQHHHHATTKGWNISKGSNSDITINTYIYNYENSPTNGQ